MKLPLYRLPIFGRVWDRVIAWALFVLPLLFAFGLAFVASLLAGFFALLP